MGQMTNYNSSPAPKQIFMSSTKDSVNVNVNSNSKFDRKFQSKYRSQPLSSRSELGKKLTSINRLDFATGVELRNQYIKYRLLSLEEEMTAGKFSHVGFRLDTYKMELKQKLGREPSSQEWAKACDLTPTQLDTYYSLALKARQRLVQHNFRLVDFWARRLIEHTTGGKSVSYYELVTEGVIGLTKAAIRYDGRGTFIKFAQPYVRSELYAGMTRLIPGSFLSHRTVMLSARANKVKERFEIIHQRKPTDQEVAKELKMSVRTLRAELNVAALKKTVISASSKIGGGSSRGSSTKTDADGKADGGDGNTYWDLLHNDEESKFASDNLQWKIEFQQALDECLTPIEKRTLTIRYGLLDGKSRSINRTAELMCNSTEGIRKIIIRAMTKLRDSPYGSILEEGPPISSTDSVRQFTRASY